MTVITNRLHGLNRTEPRPEPTGIIYRITNLLDGRVYIGKTGRTFGKRYRGGNWWKHTHNQELKADCAKIGRENFSVTILAHGLTDAEQDEAERFLISSHDCIHPRGYNLHQHGYAVSDVTRAKMSASGKKRMEKFPNPFKGMRHSLESRQMMSSIQRSRKRATTPKPPRVKKPRGKGVRKIDPQSGTVLERFTNIAAASRATGAPGQNISFSCHSSTCLCAGFKWEFEDNSSPRAVYPLRKVCREVIRVDTDGVQTRYPSISEAGRSCGSGSGNMHAAILNGWKCKGFVWKFADETP